jgi:prolyl-tRNA synthetase
MTHGDNNGLVLPPRIAPVQVVVIPVAQHKEGVLEANRAVFERLQKAGVRVKLDDSDNSPGWKFAEYEMKGVPLRLELGPKDLEKNQCVLARRDSGEKTFVSLDNIEQTVAQMLDAIHDGLYAKAKKNLEDNTYPCATLDEVKEKMGQRGGFAKAMWCGDLECELKMKEEAGVSSRCIPFQQEHLGDVCACCGKPAKHMVIWGVAY